MDNKTPLPGPLSETAGQQPIDFNFDLRHLLRWRPPPLRFDDIEEAHFQHAVGAARLRHFVASGMFALVIYNLFLLADQRMIPDVYPQALQGRLFTYTPMSLVLLLLGWRFKTFVLLLPPALVETFVTLTGVVAAMHMGWLLAASQSPFAGMYTAGLVPIIVYGNLVQRFRFRYAFAFSLVAIGTAMAGVWIRFGQGRPYEFFDIPLCLLVSLISGYTLAMNYRSELEERRRFQWTVRAQALHKKLASSQAQLDEMSRRDPLTGVPNRRHFDEFLRRNWDAAQAQGHTLALLLIDVDHFKAYNDRYGHPAGDQCLRHVALALQQAVPAASGCVARWGGEEFIVGLPGMGAEGAMQVAQGLCKAVRDLGLRHEASTTDASVTISVGMALATPSVGGGIDNLIAQADAALYRAKEGGRNRAVAATALTPVSA